MWLLVACRVIQAKKYKPIQEGFGGLENRIVAGPSGAVHSNCFPVTFQLIVLHPASS